MTLDALARMLPTDNGLIPIVYRNQDTGHRLTARAWEVLWQHYAPTSPQRHYDRIVRELVALMPVARVAWNNQDLLGVLQTDYDFALTHDDRPDRLWYAGSDSVLVMLAQEYR